MELREFRQEDYDTLIHWIDSERLNYQWGGPNFDFPLDHDQLEHHCVKAEVLPFIFISNGEEAGYVELFKVSGSQYRICRVFVSNDFRGQGMAKIMLNQLIEKARVEYNAQVLTLAVFERNVVAKRCYESLGFVVTSRESGTRSFDGELWDLLLMEKHYN
ncbi:GNAT family N-acetyltransferase [Vibrio fortis]|uniref:GNAT family N-acetyltransferase n=1 Tax=Vibrio fortis TaxID=212667 RepID=UPI0021C36263|nr:GNAT family protein [Vibrio fortis]